MRSGFLDENLRRDYPFVSFETGGLPKYAIVDFGCIVGPDAQYIDGTDVIYLRQLRRIGDRLEFEFRSTASGLTNSALIFTRPITDGNFISQFVEASPASSALELEQSCSFSSSSQPSASESDSVSIECSTFLWEGYLVTGDIARLVDHLGECGSFGSSSPIEPALIQNLGDSIVTGITIANANRTRVVVNAACNEYCWPFDIQDYYVIGRCLQGDVRFHIGYNAHIRQNDFDNSIAVDALVGGGEGEPCKEVKQLTTEGPPNGLSLLTGGPSCGEVVNSINGVANSSFRIEGGIGTKITAIPEIHRVIVDVNLNNLTLCPALDPDIPAPCEAPNANPCECGDLEVSSASCP